LWTFC